MTKRVNIICLVAFFLCLAGAYALQLLTGGMENTNGMLRYISNIIGVAMLALFPFSVMSYLFTRSWREVRKDKVKAEFIRKNPLLTFFIWREIRDEEIDAEQR